MMETMTITILHVSDTQFGCNYRFAGSDLSSLEGRFDTLLSRLKMDIKKLGDGYNLHPDILIMTGDLTEKGLKSEMQNALSFIIGIEESLGLPRERIVLIPGNHDVKRKACEAYFCQCDANEQKPVKPYWDKWSKYNWLFEQLYGSQTSAKFTEHTPWTLFPIDDVKVVVAGLNSTIAESHKDQDHYGFLGENQLKWFADRLAKYKEEGWFRIAALHHNVQRAAKADNENLKDADDFKNILQPFIN
ncbi:MAG: metallophosphoesterase [Thermodesulfobacteriota bacterium]|nr:metallophosphoesterase [Thermodesulfobacteriota bacterium]